MATSCVAAATFVVPAAAQAQARASYDIPAGSLASMLNRFAREAGVELIYDAALTVGISSPEFTGNFGPAEALSRLLTGTGLTFRQTAPRTFTLERAPQAADGTIRLGPVRVEGRAGTGPGSLPPPQAEIGSLPGDYAGGQIARGGKLGILGNRDFTDTPFSQTSYTQTLMRNQQSRTIADVLANDPSVQGAFPQGSGIDNFFIRGFQSGNQDVTFNGLYGIAPTSNGAAAVETLERVEILKGPSALLNGIGPQGSIGGTINLVPKRAGDDPLTQVTGNYYSDAQLGGHVDIGRRLGGDGRFGVRFNGAYRDGDTAIDDQSERLGLAALALDYRGNRLRLSADLGYQSRRTDAVRREISLAPGVAVPDEPDGSSNYSQPWTFYEAKNLYGAVRGELDILSDLTLFAAAGLGRQERRARFELLRLEDGEGTLDVRINANNAYEDTETIEAGLRGNFTTGFIDHALTVAHAIYWGEFAADVSLVNLDDSNLNDPIVLPEPDAFPSLFTGEALRGPADALKYLEVRFSSLSIVDTLSALDGRIQLTAGVRRQQVRQDGFNRASGDRTSRYEEAAWSPAFALIVKPGRNLSLYANYIEGLQPGPTAPADAVNSGEIFAPYESTQYEIGVKADFGDLAVTMALFELSQPNAFTDPDTSLFGLNGEVRNRGLEVSLFGEPVPGLRIIGGMTLLDAEFTRTLDGVNHGNDVPGVPDLQAMLAGEWDVPGIEGLTMTSRLIHSAKKPVNDANTDRLPSWTRLDLGARYTIASTPVPVSIRVNIENLLDADYWAAANGSRSFGLSTPRTVLLSATVDF